MKLKLLVLLVCIFLGGCTVQKWELLKAEQQCKDRGGVGSIEILLKNTFVMCLDGNEFKLVSNYNPATK